MELFQKRDIFCIEYFFVEFIIFRFVEHQLFLFAKLVNGDMKNVNFEQFNCFEFFQLFAHFVTDCVPP